VAGRGVDVEEPGRRRRLGEPTAAADLSVCVSERVVGAGASLTRDFG
jgi:hypothetical protein